MKKVLVGLSVLLSACVVPGPKPVVTPPPTVHQLAVHVESAGVGINGAIVSVVDAAPNPNAGATGTANTNGDVTGWILTQSGFTICAQPAGYLQACQGVTLTSDQSVDLSLTPTRPPVPTRTQVGSVQTSFQGLTVQTQQFGAMPWYGPALAWLDNPADRQAVYAAEKAAGDTHSVLFLPWGPALYDEPGQFYTADKFPPRDWTAGGTAINPRFVALVDEVVQSGLTPIIFLGGDDGEAGYVVAIKQLPLLIAALGDLNAYVLIVPGFDGVFYGWTPDHIGAFGQLFRSLSPNGYLGIEHSTGHIPCGEGDADWVTGGRMQTYDVLLSEFDTDNLHQDSTWQIAGRTIGPAFRRPSDEPAGDDPSPPWYLRQGTARGPFFVVAFEFDTYYWVRTLSAAMVQLHRAYLQSLGYTFTG